jgi:hypothetical protein
MLLSNISSFALLAAIASVAAHANHNLEQEKEERRIFLDGLDNNALEHCTVKLKQMGLEHKIIQRRQQLAHSLRKRTSETQHHGR